jgi:tetratricopeptide (TPR) repeat protein
MNINYFSRRALVFLLVSLFYLPAHADTEKTATEKRAENIDRLLNTSSGAKQVVNGTSQAAREKRKDAVVIYENALAEMARGNDSAAAEMLSQASKIMFDAIRLSTPTVVTEEKDVTDYKNRKESVVALRDAFDRISQEDKEFESNRSKVNSQLDELVAEAEKLMNKGETPQARIEMDKAYHLVKVSIDSIRSGQTLVRSLNFETPRDEYLYELDRNDTHSMLVGLLVDEKKQSAYSKDSVARKVIEADKLRAQAESYAAQDAYEQAIELLEQSTKQLVRAIRSAGIYIPG